MPHAFATFAASNHVSAITPHPAAQDSVIALRIAVLMLERHAFHMPANVTEIEKRLWISADELCANSYLRAFKYPAPVLRLLSLRFADEKLVAAVATNVAR